MSARQALKNKKIPCRLRKGSGESMEFAVISVAICTLIVFLAGIVQLNMGMRQLENAVSTASRTAAISSSLEDAEELALAAAESSITSPLVTDVDVEITFPSGDETWGSGNCIRVTVSGYVNTATKYFSSGVRSRSSMVVIEEGTYTGTEIQLLAALIQAEAGNSEDGMLAVGTIVMNRVGSDRFPDTIEEVIFQTGQFAVTWDGALERALASPDVDALRIAADILSGARYPGLEDYYYFLSAGSTSRTEGINIGGNFFFKKWSDS